VDSGPPCRARGAAEIEQGSHPVAVCLVRLEIQVQQRVGAVACYWMWGSDGRLAEDSTVAVQGHDSIVYTLAGAGQSQFLL
jgi:hypothetical protein